MIVNITKNEMLVLCDCLDIYIDKHKGLSRSRVVGTLKEKMDKFKDDIENNKMGWDKEITQKYMDKIIEIYPNPKRKRYK